MVDLKKKYRDEIKLKINSYTTDCSKLKSEQILVSLKKILASFSGLWAAFKPLKTEPNIDFLQIKNLEWAFPTALNSKLVFKKNVASWTRSQMGVLEPQDGDNVDLTSFEGFVIPCLGMNALGFRLGRGGGFYDRTFDLKINQDLNKKFKVGICFDEAVKQEIPHQPHDLLLDIGITEQKVYFFNSKIKNVFNI
jgi:5-formyltetrahydrofolate cyclo-ligase